MHEDFLSSPLSSINHSSAVNYLQAQKGIGQHYEQYMRLKIRILHSAKQNTQVNACFITT